MSRAPQALVAMVELTVDLIEVQRFCFVVRDRVDGREHRIDHSFPSRDAEGREFVVGYDHIAIGSNAKGDAYTLIMPRVLAKMQGFCQ